MIIPTNIKKKIRTKKNINPKAKIDRKKTAETKKSKDSLSIQIQKNTTARSKNKGINKKIGKERNSIDKRTGIPKIEIEINKKTSTVKDSDHESALRKKIDPEAKRRTLESVLAKGGKPIIMTDFETKETTRTKSDKISTNDGEKKRTFISIQTFQIR